MPDSSTQRSASDLRSRCVANTRLERIESRSPIHRAEQAPPLHLTPLNTKLPSTITSPQTTQPSSGRPTTISNASSAGLIDRTLDRALPHNNRADNAAMRTRLSASIRQDIERSLQGDRQLGEQIAQVKLSARRLDEATRSQVVRLIGERAQQLVPVTTRRVLGEWTQTTLARLTRERAGRSDAATSRHNVEPAQSFAGSTGNAFAECCGCAIFAPDFATRNVLRTPRCDSFTESAKARLPPRQRLNKFWTGNCNRAGNSGSQRAAAIGAENPPAKRSRRYRANF